MDLTNIRHIVTHAKCADGVASAMILKDVLPSAKVTFLQYGISEYLNLLAEPGMLFCDFSPPQERVSEFISVGALILDHHKTAKAVVDAFGANGAFGDETNDPGVCGAVLAYRHVWLPLKNHNHAEIVKTVENFARLAGIRDTWQKNSPDWNEACYQSEALVFWPEDELIGLNPLEWSEKLSLGKILFKRKIDWAKQCVEGSYRFISNSGTKVIIFEGTKASSDSSEIIGNEADLVVGFNTFVEDEKIKVIYSTRSRAEFNCAEFCKSLGGGGHTKAAGFGITISPIDPHPFYLFQNILNKYEKSQNTKVVDL